MFSNLHTMKCTDQMKGLLNGFLSNSLSSKVGVSFEFSRLCRIDSVNHSSPLHISRLVSLQCW